MNVNFIKNIVSADWMIEPNTLCALQPLLNGVFQGLEFIEEKQEVFNRFEIPNKDDASCTTNVINVVNLQGTIMKYDTYCGTLGTMTIAQEMLKADQDPDVIGHIIRTDSGGGSGSAIREMQLIFPKLTKPCIGLIDGYACSAAYYILSYCNRIFAHHELDRVGSIGTMCQFASMPTRAELADGQIALRIYADTSGDKNNEYEEALKGNYKIIKEEFLNPINQRFIEDIKANRPKVGKEHLTGRAYFAHEVMDTLVDEIGDFEACVKYLCDKANCTECEITTPDNEDDSETEQKCGDKDKDKIKLSFETPTEKLNSIINMEQYTELQKLLNRESLETTEQNTLQESDLQQLNAAIVELQAAHQKEMESKEVTIEQMKTKIAELDAKIATAEKSAQEQAEKINAQNESIEQLTEALKASEPKAAEETATVAPITDEQESISFRESLRNYCKNL